MRVRTILAVTIPAAVATCFVAFAPRGESADPGPQRIAVVDMLELISTSPGKTAIDTKRTTMQDEIKKWDQGQVRALEKMQTDLGALTQTSAKYGELKLALMQHSAVYKAEGQYKVEAVNAVYANDLEELYADVRKHVREVASSAGYSMVLFRSDTPLEIGRAGEFAPNVALRCVIWSDTTHDLTAQVRARLAALAPRVPPTPSPVPAPAPPSPIPGGGLPPPAMDR